MDLLTWFSSAVGVMATTGRRRRGVPIPRTSIETASENSSKTFQRDPMVGCIFMDLLTRFSTVVGGMGPTGRR